MAITADGMIGKHSDHLADWTSKADKKHFVQFTKEVGVLIMGKTTYDTIGRPLPGRLNVIMDLHPDVSQNIEGELEFTNTQPAELLGQIEVRGFDRCIIAGGATINGLFLKAGLVDEIKITVEPKLFGEGLSLFRGADVDLDLKLLSCEKISENSVQLHYRLVK